MISMELLLAHWDLILVLVVAVIGGVFATKKWLAQPSSKQKEQIKAVLLQLVITAEKAYGSKTGRVKFSYVYTELLKQFTLLKFVPISVVEGLVNESLELMRKLLESNDEVKKIVNKDK